ncbi:TniQ family protein [uncultured Pseudodesulfovibrio sp.]|uniref:TniQ family protein n=1 Tax=uncultured Pseudodesulfovibrio sp. TaxID=2035858 RepID=UPI0029C86477|nr:TniQ family protein [uncultured Pseudodesulfovibrio sp.]
MLSGKLLPVHPKPLPDELITSWIVRIAEANAVKLHTLTRFLFGDHKRSPWVRDVARSGPDWLVDKISEVIGVSRNVVRGTTFDSYFRKVFPCKQVSGQLRWLLPAKIRSSNRLGYSIQYCPVCLSDDTHQYFRRRWRMGFYTFCAVHGLMLLDACPQCDSPIVIHRRDFTVDVNQAGKISQCHVCGLDMRVAPKITPDVYEKDVNALYFNLLSSFDNFHDRGMVYGLQYFAVLHHLCKLIVMMPNKGKLRTHVARQIGIADIDLARGRFPFEQRRVQERYYVISLALWLSQNLKERLRAAWEAGAVRYNLLLKDFPDPPKEYLNLVEPFNRRKKY